MHSADSSRTFYQVVDWYLLWASQGKHSPNGEPKSISAIRVQRGLLLDYVDDAFRNRRFVEISAQEMQEQIDRVAMSGAGPASLGLRNLFVDVDKFAVRQAVLPKLRTHGLIALTNTRDPRRLSDQEFGRAWKSFMKGATNGALPMKAPCLAILLSGATLQPLQAVVRMRRSAVHSDRRLWTVQGAEPVSIRYIHLSDLAVELIGMAFELGDFIHREERTPFVFPSSGPKRNPRRPVGFSSLFKVTADLVPNLDFMPTDLRETGIETLKGLGGAAFGLVVDRIAAGTDEIPSEQHVLLTDGWADRVRDLAREVSGSVRFLASVDH